ncbi:UNVERIFIED_CONTAM: hypothetical protein HDU68_011177 [Siphonaria sp. JEL0065]|nr:hypothetical protein HDU68_011177 [Siphonaria sp. JEL0065]
MPHQPYPSQQNNHPITPQPQLPQPSSTTQLPPDSGFLFPFSRPGSLYTPAATGNPTAAPFLEVSQALTQHQQRTASHHQRHSSSYHVNEASRLHPYRRSHHLSSAGDSVPARSGSTASALGNGEYGVRQFSQHQAGPGLGLGLMVDESQMFLSPSSDDEVEGRTEDLMGDGQGYAASPVAGDLEDELDSGDCQGNTVPPLPHGAIHGYQSVHANNGSQYLVESSAYGGQAGIGQQQLNGSHKSQTQQPITLQQQVPVMMPQNDPQKIQDAEDLASFTAWVTLRLLERRWSLLMQQNNASKGSIASATNVGGTAAPIVMSSVASAPVGTLNHQSAPPNNASIQTRPLLNRYQAPQQRIDPTFGYREDQRADSIATFQSMGSTIVGNESYWNQAGVSIILPSSAPISVQQEDQRVNSVAHHVSTFGLAAPVNFTSPQSSPLMGQQQLHQQQQPVQYASSPASDSIHIAPHQNLQSVDTLGSNNNLPSMRQYFPQSVASSSSTSIVKQAPSMFIPQQSAITNIPQQVQPPPQKHSLPPAYISHYASKLTRLTQLTLLRAPTPPQTTLLALHLLRRLISTPRSLPTRITTPTRMLLGCLMVADSLFGGERGVPSRDWKIIAQVSGLRDGAEGVNEEAPSPDGESGLGFVAGIKKDVLVFLGFDLHSSVVGFPEWMGVLKDFLKDDGTNSGGAEGDRKRRTRRILDDLSLDGRSRLDMAWRW